MSKHGSPGGSPSHPTPKAARSWEGEAPAEPRPRNTREGEAPAEPSARPQRKHLSHDVFIVPDQPTIVFATICTKDRRPWLANPGVHDLLIRVWHDARAWLVGRYVVMPDHIHLFCAPGALELPLANWVTYWKSQFSKQHGDASHRWQSGTWDTRLRRGESYDEKWEYVRMNPVRHGLVGATDDWPYQGELNVLPWS